MFYYSGEPLCRDFGITFETNPIKDNRPTNLLMRKNIIKLAVPDAAVWLQGFQQVIGKLQIASEHERSFSELANSQLNYLIRTDSLLVHGNVSSKCTTWIYFSS